MSHEMKKANEAEKDLGLNEDEVAFYYALTADDVVKQFMDDETLKRLLKS